MYYIYGISGPSLLIESTDSMIGCTATGQSASIITATAKWLKPPFTYVLEHSIEHAHL